MGWKPSNVHKLANLFTGRGNLRTWTYRMGRSQSLVCRGCNADEESAGHVIFQCEKNGRSRAELGIDPTQGWQGLTESQVESLWVPPREQS